VTPAASNGVIRCRSSVRPGADNTDGAVGKVSLSSNKINNSNISSNINSISGSSNNNNNTSYCRGNSNCGSSSGQDCRIQVMVGEATQEATQAALAPMTSSVRLSMRLPAGLSLLSKETS